MGRWGDACPPLPIDMDDVGSCTLLLAILSFVLDAYPFCWTFCVVCVVNALVCAAQAGSQQVHASYPSSMPPVTCA